MSPISKFLKVDDVTLHMGDLMFCKDVGGRWYRSTLSRGGEV